MTKNDKQIKCNAWCCSNYKHEGDFVGEFCAPCYGKITTGIGDYGTAWFYQLSDDWQRIKDKIDKINIIIEE